MLGLKCLWKTAAVLACTGGAAFAAPANPVSGPATYGSPFASNASIPSLPPPIPFFERGDRYSASLKDTTPKPILSEEVPMSGLKLLLRRDRLDAYSETSRIDDALASASPYPIDRRDVAVDWQLGLVSPANRSGLGLDIGFTPRGSFGVSETGQSRGAGAQLSLGRFLNATEAVPKSWYLFAAADGQQLTWDLDRTSAVGIAPGMRLGERVVVGDVQAGISIARFGGQFGLAYMQRDVSYETAHRSEQFAAFSFSMKR
jgi:hypothetical protein